MNDIPKPEISPAFTIEDIHKIREWNYERRKGMTPEEICEDTRRGAERFLSTIVDPSIEAEVQQRLEAISKKYRQSSLPLPVIK